MSAIMLTTDIPMPIAMFASRRVGRMQFAMLPIYVAMIIAMPGAWPVAVPAPVLRPMVTPLIAMIGSVLPPTGIGRMDFAMFARGVTVIFSMATIRIIVVMMRLLNLLYVCSLLPATDLADAFGKPASQAPDLDLLIGIGANALGPLDPMNPLNLLVLFNLALTPFKSRLAGDVPNALDRRLLGTLFAVLGSAFIFLRQRSSGHHNPRHQDRN